MQLLLHFSNDTLTHTMLSILMFLVLNNNKMSKELCVFFFLRVKHACIIGTIFHPIKSTCREFVCFVLLLYFVCFSPIVCLDLLLCQVFLMKGSISFVCVFWDRRRWLFLKTIRCVTMFFFRNDLSNKESMQFNTENYYYI